MSTPLERAIARFRRDRFGGRPPYNGLDTGRISAAKFRAATDERLRALERDIAEVKGRVNGLIFVVAGAVVTQVILRLIQ